MGSAAWNPQSLRPSPPGGVPGTARASGRAGFHGCAVWAAPTARVKECVATGVGGTRYAAVRQTSADSGGGGLAVPRPHHDRAAPVQHGRRPAKPSVEPVDVLGGLIHGYPHAA